jgi:hypothetical protein
MALAATKTWSFFSEVQAYGDVTGDTYYARWLFDLKEFLVNSMGWTVRGGYSGNTNTLYHNDGSNNDPWPTYLDARKGISSRDTYIIIRAPAAVGQEICYGANYSSSATYTSRVFFYSSQSGFFGATESGANGTSGSGAVPPTAADGVTWYAHNTNSQTIPTQGTYTFIGAKTSDDKHHRIFCQTNRVVSGMWFFEHLNNPHANLDDGGRVASVRMANIYDSNDTVMDGDSYTSTLWQGKVSGVNRSFYAGAGGYANNNFANLVRARADDKIVVTPIDLYNNTTNEQGYYGTVPDLYWGNAGFYGQLLGDSVGATANWFSGGTVVTPWDPTEPLPRNY